jgi:hypothetical protein
MDATPEAKPKDSLEDSQIVHDYLFARYRVALEDLLAYGSAGVLSLALEHAGVRVRSGCLHRERHDDGGLSEVHEGTLSLAGAAYAFRIGVFTDADGDRFLSDLLDFKPLGWSAGLRLGVEAAATSLAPPADRPA